MLVFRFILPAVIAALTQFIPAAAFADTPLACNILLTTCGKAGYVGDKSETACLGPLLQGLSVNGFPDVPQSLIARCNVERTEGKSLIPPAPPATLDGTRAKGAGAEPALPWPPGKPLRPNIVMILADDYDLQLMTQDQNVLARSMPNLAQMIRDGVTFSHYFVTDSLCCPSRSSIFTGLLPHNTGVYTNAPPDGGFSAFVAHGDPAKTFAVLLHAAGYATGMMGKYLNLYAPERDGVGPGWSEWAVAGEAYTNFNYVLNHNGILRTPGPHLTDEISLLGQAFIRANVARPLFLELSSFSPHGPFIPPVRFAQDLLDVTYPRSPAYGARPDVAAPDWLKAIIPLTPEDDTRGANTYRRRMQSDEGIDEMIGAVRQLLTKLGIADRTYVIFTSDNGFHMGEYSLRFGKLTPFDTDIQVPLVVVGPGITPGSSVDALTENIDLAPTFADIAGLPPPPVDGRSLLGLMQGRPSDPWRQTVLVEHHHTSNNANNPDAPPSYSGDPPNYEALRLKDALYVEYNTGEVSYYDLTSDPYELHNVAPGLSPERRKALHAALAANQRCTGPGACWAVEMHQP